MGSPGTRITDNCGPPCKCWELNLEPLEEQSVLLTVELFLQLREVTFCNKKLTIDWVVTTHAFNPSTWEAEAGALL